MNVKIPLKRQRLVRRLLQGPLHRFEAEKHPVFDHCLPSTISELKSQFGLVSHATTIRLLISVLRNGVPSRARTEGHPVVFDLRFWATLRETDCALLQR